MWALSWALLRFIRAYPYVTDGSQAFVAHEVVDHGNGTYTLKQKCNVESDKIFKLFILAERSAEQIQFYRTISFSLLMTQEIVNAGYIPKAILPYLLNSHCLARTAIFLTLTLPSLKKLFYPTFLLYARITNSFIGALVYTT